MTFNYKKYLPFIIIFFISFLVFFNSLNNGFVWDDEEQIINNTVIRSLNNVEIIFSGGAFNSGGTGKLLGVYYKPLMTFTFALIYSLFKLNPFYYHLISIIIYTINACLVYILLTKFFDNPPVGGKSLLLALIFLAHPLYSEIALYMANMQDLLYFLFGILGLILFTSNRPTLKTYISISILFLLSLLSKETGVLFIILSGIYSLIFERSRFIKILVTGTISVIIYSILRFKIAGIYFPTHDMAPIANLTLTERLMNIPALLNYYLSNYFWPANITINQHWVTKVVNLSYLILPILALILLFRKSKTSIFFMLILFFSLLPHMQIFPLDVTASGRWFYIGSVGILGLIGVLLKKNMELLLVIPILCFSLITINRTYDFRNGFALYSKDIKYDKDNFNLENNLGVEYYRMGKYDKAGYHFQRSVDLNPKWWTNYNNLGVYQEGLGNLDKALFLYKKAIDNGQYYLAYENYAKVLIKQKKYDEALQFINESLKYFPENTTLQNLVQKK